MEPIHPLLVSTRSGVDQQDNRRAQSDPGATLNPGRLSGSRGVTSFLKVTAAAQQWPSPGNLSSPRCRLQRSAPAKPSTVVTINVFLAKIGGSLEQSTTTGYLT